MGKKRYIPASAKKRKYPHTHLRLGSRGKNFVGISKFLGNLQVIFLPREFNLIVVKTQFCYHDNPQSIRQLCDITKIASHDHCQETVLLSNLGAAPTVRVISLEDSRVRFVLIPKFWGDLFLTIIEINLGNEMWETQPPKIVNKLVGKRRIP